MPFDQDFLDDMPTTVMIAPWQGRDKYDKHTHGADVAYRCRLETGAQQITDADGKQAVSMTRLFLAGAFPAVTVKSKLTMPAGTEPNSPPILRVEQVYDEKGPHHTVVYC